MILSAICNCCWSKLSNFHDFYEDIERAQKHLNFEVIVKTENNLQFINTTIEEIFPNKHETNDNSEGLYEVPLSAPPLKLFEENNGDLMDFDNQPDLQYQSINKNDEEIVDNYVDKYAKTEMNGNKETTSPILEGRKSVNKKKTHREKATILKKRGRIFSKGSKNNVVDELLEPNYNTILSSSYKGRGRPRKGQVVPLKNKTKSNGNDEGDSADLNPQLSQNVEIKPKANCGKFVKAKNYKDGSDSADITPQEVSQNVNRTIAEYMQLKCDICGLELSTFGLIRNHMMTVHDIHPYVKCCEKKFSKRALLYDHIKFHLNPNIYKCEKCDKLFTDKRSLTNHDIVKHQSEENKIFQCPQCPKKFAKKLLITDSYNQT